MSGAARLLLQRGASVSGSDRQASLLTQQLAADGARVYIGHAAAFVPRPVDVVVHSAAIPASNPELTAARQRGCEIVSYAGLLGRLMEARAGVAVAGTHGKSTTTAMTAFILRLAGLRPSFIVGATVDQLGGGAAADGGEHFVVEACEYGRSFLKLRPKFGCILNIEEDHLDYYADLDEIIQAFGQFAGRVARHGALVACRGDANVRRAVRNGVQTKLVWFDAHGSHADWSAGRVHSHDGCCAFDLLHRGRSVGRVQLSVPGRHNVHNALAAAALAHECGCAAEHIVAGLGTFAGAGRRLTCRGYRRGVAVVDDYAHHPTEVRATLAATRERYRPKRLFGVFQPHQHSRTRFLLDDFARSFEAADVVVVPDIYFVRDSEAERQLVRAEDLVSRLCANGRTARYLPDFSEIAKLLVSLAEAGDVIVTMGAGDVWKVADEVVLRLGSDR